MTRRLRRLLRVLLADRGWRVVHVDHLRMVYTLERDRRYCRGPFRIATYRQLRAEGFAL